MKDCQFIIAHSRGRLKDFERWISTILKVETSCCVSARRSRSRSRSSRGRVSGPNREKSQDPKGVGSCVVLSQVEWKRAVWGITRGSGGGWRGSPRVFHTLLLGGAESALQLQTLSRRLFPSTRRAGRFRCAAVYRPNQGAAPPPRSSLALSYRSYRRVSGTPCPVNCYCVLIVQGPCLPTALIQRTEYRLPKSNVKVPR